MQSYWGVVFKSKQALPNQSLTICLFQAQSSIGLVLSRGWVVIIESKTNLAQFQWNFQLELSLAIALMFNINNQNYFIIFLIHQNGKTFHWLFFINFPLNPTKSTGFRLFIKAVWNKIKETSWGWAGPSSIPA